MKHFEVQIKYPNKAGWHSFWAFYWSKKRAKIGLKKAREDHPMNKFRIRSVDETYEIFLKRKRGK